MTEMLNDTHMLTEHVYNQIKCAALELCLGVLLLTKLGLDGMFHPPMSKLIC